MALDLTSVVIPLDCRSNARYMQSRCYASDHLIEVLETIAGPGNQMLWWEEKEIPWAMSFDDVNWAWIPHGEVDQTLSSHFTNCMTHMKIFFKDPNHAILFKLTWI